MIQCIYDNVYFSFTTVRVFDIYWVDEVSDTIFGPSGPPDPTEPTGTLYVNYELHLFYCCLYFTDGSKSMQGKLKLRTQFTSMHVHMSFF